MAKVEKTEEVKETQAVAVIPAGGALADFMGADMFDGATGFEGADVDSFALPFLMVLQKMSPLVDEDDAKYVKGAKAGMLYNTVTGQLYDGKEGVLIIPAAYKRSYVRWGGREGDGGFKGEITVEAFNEMKLNPALVKEVDGKLYAPAEDGSVNVKKSDYFADTRSHFVLIVNPETGEYGRAIISCSSSQIKSSKKLMTSMNEKKVMHNGKPRTPPTFANIVKATTIAMSNDQGNWSAISFELAGLVGNADWYKAAKEFHDAVIGGSVGADYSKSAETGTDSGDKEEDGEF